MFSLNVSIHYTKNIEMLEFLLLFSWHFCPFFLQSLSEHSMVFQVDDELLGVRVEMGLDFAYDVNLTILRVYFDRREDSISNEFCGRLLMSKLLNSGAWMITAVCSDAKLVTSTSNRGCIQSPRTSIKLACDFIASYCRAQCFEFESRMNCIFTTGCFEQFKCVKKSIDE